MEGEWTTVRLADLCEFRAGSVFKPEYQGQSAGAYPFVKVSDMNLPENSVRIQAANNWVSESDVRALKAKPLQQGTVVFAKIGEALRQNRLRQVVRDTVIDNNMMGAIPRRERVDPAFFYYALAQFNFADIAHGTALPYLTVASLSTLELACPPLAEQRAIARILGALDDKIELNRKMNATLEAMARALFKSWFVQEPEADRKTAPLAEWVDVLSGGTPSKSNAAFWGGPLKWISPKAMTSIHADECDDHVSGQAVGNGTRIAPKGSTLVMVRGMGLHDGVRVSQAREDVTFNQDVKALVPRTIEADLLLFAMLDAQEELHRRVETSGHGTGKMPSEILLAHPITMPPRDVQRELALHLSALNDRIAGNRSESRSLARMRDDLLPRLLSGELPVDQAECAVEDVA